MNHAAERTGGTEHQETIADCCDKGDRLAIEAYRSVGFMLGWGWPTMPRCLIRRPSSLRVTMTQAGKWLLKPMRASFEEHVFHNIRGKVRLLVSILKEGERDVLGASALAWDVKRSTHFLNRRKI